LVSTEVKYERDDYVRAIRFMSRRQNRAFSLLLLLGGLCFTLMYVGRAMNGESEWWLVLLGPCLFVFFYLLFRAFQVRSIAKQLQNSPDAQAVHHWIISDDGLMTNSELGSSQIRWGAVIKFRESKSDFFFFTAPRFAKFIPKRTLPEQQQMELRRLATENLSRSRA